jgi:unsaturated rhamnogalacturonyl hydrolase
MKEENEVLRKNEINALLERVAQRMTKIEKGDMPEQCPIGIIDFENWEWPQGVGLFGLFKYYETTRDESILVTLIEWYERRLNEGLPEKNVNTMAPMLPLACLYEVTRNERYLSLCKEWVQWVIDEMPRTKDRGLQHIASGVINEQQLWVDTLFMTVLFVAKMGVILHRKDYIEEALHQFLIHIKYLFDKKTGLWFHGWTFIENNNFAEALWARGNCWYTAGVVEFIDMIEIKGAVKQYLIDTLVAQVEKLQELQAKEGMWHTLLDDTNSYVETSATAGFGYGILKAVRKGYIDEKYKTVGEKALNAVIENISNDGTVEQVSYGTGMGSDLNHYKNIPICPITYGQALAILILNEGIECINKNA